MAKKLKDKVFIDKESKEDMENDCSQTVSYTHLRANETEADIV